VATRKTLITGRPKSVLVHPSSTAVGLAGATATHHQPDVPVPIGRDGVRKGLPGVRIRFGEQPFEDSLAQFE
jgi:hypothetical protein